MKFLNMLEKRKQNYIFKFQRKNIEIKKKKNTAKIKKKKHDQRRRILGLDAGPLDH